MTTRERIEQGLAKVRGHHFVEVRDGMPCLEVSKDTAHDVLRALRDACGFETNTFVTAIDRFPAEPRFEVTWQLLSLEHADRVRIRARVSADDPHVPSVVDLWPGADFSERECYDMFGVVFDGHPDLRRLMMPEEYEYFPLRKEFPHRGIEPDRLYREWDRRRRLEQGFPAR